MPITHRSSASNETRTFNNDNKNKQQKVFHRHIRFTNLFKIKYKKFKSKIIQPKDLETEKLKTEKKYYRRIELKQEIETKQLDKR